MNRRTRTLLLILIGLAAANFLLLSLVTGDGRNLAGETVAADSPRMRRAIFSTVFFGLPAVSFILGALLALIPRPGRPYAARFVTLGLYAAICAEAVVLALGLIRLITG